MDDDELKECPWCGQTTHYYLQKDAKIICDSCKKEVEDGRRRKDT